MISFQRLGRYGRLGNQLFQYAFLRTTAQRLGVKFYCPKWAGDRIFHLNDEKERAEKPEGISKGYNEPVRSQGYNEDALKIEDGTEIFGHFETDKYYQDKEKVRCWYTFKEDAVARVKEEYRHTDFSRSVGLHLRFGDKVSLPRAYCRHYFPAAGYYIRALSQVKHKENILVFSDEMDTARNRLKGLRGNIVYMEGNRDYEDLYLMTQCHDFICSPSTLSWWGAWLNPRQDKTIVAPTEGHLRPGCPIKNTGYWCDGWVNVKALNPIVDSYHVISLLKFPEMILHYLSRRV